MEKKMTKNECGLLKKLNDANKWFVILNSKIKESLADINEKSNIQYW